MFTLAGVEDPAGSAQRVMDVETRLAQGHWERAATRDVIKTYNLMGLDDLKQAAPAFAWDAWAAALGADESTLAEVVVREPQLLRAPVEGASRRSTSRTGGPGPPSG